MDSRENSDDEGNNDVYMPPLHAAATSSKPDLSAFLPWVEKYRPNSLSDLISQNDIVSTITKLIDAGRLPHLLFYGPPGTGKTSTILAIAKKLYGPNYSAMVLELNASDDRGIDVVREQIKTFAGTRKLFSSGVKLVVLDEADAMTSDAQFALRRVIEKYTKNTRFCLICNYVSKIIPALQSRCTRFRFAPLKRDQIESRLRYIIDKEGLSTRASEDGVASILHLGGGDMRRVLNILQATASGFPTIDADAVYACTGSPHPADMRKALQILLTADFKEACEHILSLGQTKGLALADIVAELGKECAKLAMPGPAHAVLLEKLADIDYRLAAGASEKIQGVGLVGVFAAVREQLDKAAMASVTGQASRWSGSVDEAGTQAAGASAKAAGAGASSSAAARMEDDEDM